MRPTFSTFCTLAAASAGLAFASLPALAQQEESLTVLVVNSYDEDTAPYFRVRDTFMAELQRRRAAPIALRQFNLEERDAAAEFSHGLRAQLLRIQYAEKPPSLVVAIGPPAMDFWLAHRDPDFAATPFIASASEAFVGQAALRPADAAVANRFTFVDMVENILELLPETSRIFVVLGASAHERRLTAQAKLQLASYAGRIEFEFANDLPLKALQEKLARFGAGTAVLHGIFDSDVNGVLLGNYSGLALVRAASRVPVFGAFDDQLGRGIIGGRLIELEATGRELARTADEMLGGGAPSGPRRLLDLSAPTYDWRELQAWNIDPARLPPGSIVRFKPPSLLQQYFGWVLLILLVAVGQTVLVGALLLQRRRRRRAELASRDLGSRLINAHEEERRRIARELHDDLSQRLARLSIDASYVAANPEAAASREILQNMQPELVSVSKDVHDMSYRLHPSLLDDLGLAAALQAECDRLRRRSGLEIVERFGDLSVQLPRDVALCIYRIAQEALHNAIRHAKAGTIEIAVESGPQSLNLTVSDDGVGFEKAEDHTHIGLGLSSMRERARLVGGSLDIRSRPGQGTTVSLTVPRKAKKE